MRIAVDNVTPGRSTGAVTLGGMRMYLEELLTGLAGAGQGHEYLLFGPAGSRSLTVPWSPRLRLVGCVGLPAARPARILYEQTVYPWLVTRERPDVFLGTCNTLPFALRVPSAVVVQSFQFFITPQAYGPLQRSYLRLATLAAVRKARAVIALSEAAKGEIVAMGRVPPERVRVVYHGVSENCRQAARHRPLPAPKALSEIGAAGHPYVLSVSSFYPYKNLLGTITAFADLVRTSDLKLGHRLVLVGGDTAAVTAADLRRHAEELGVGDRVLTLGRVPHDQIPALYANADALVMASFSETFGHPILEAMTLGCPVVTSNLSCMPEIAGGAAELVDPHDAQSIRRGLARILTHPEHRARLVERGLEWSRPFTWAQCARRTREVLEHVARSPS